MIRDIETALMGVLRECQLPAGVSIESAPGEWSAGYVQRLVQSLPAVRLAFLGAGEYPDDQTELQLRGMWGCCCLTGWNGEDQAQRRHRERCRV